MCPLATDDVIGSTIGDASTSLGVDDPQQVHIDVYMSPIRWTSRYGPQI